MTFDSSHSKRDIYPSIISYNKSIDLLQKEN